MHSTLLSIFCFISHYFEKCANTGGIPPHTPRFITHQPCLSQSSRQEDVTPYGPHTVYTTASNRLRNVRPFLTLAALHRQCILLHGLNYHLDLLSKLLIISILLLASQKRLALGIPTQSSFIQRKLTAYYSAYISYRGTPIFVKHVNYSLYILLRTKDLESSHIIYLSIIFIIDI